MVLTGGDGNTMVTLWVVALAKAGDSTLAESFAWFLLVILLPHRLRSKLESTSRQEGCWLGRTDTAGYGVFDTSNDGPPFWLTSPPTAFLP